mgnify:FL=1
MVYKINLEKKKEFESFNFRQVLKRFFLFETAADSNLPIVYNVNIGHSSPKCIIPFGVTAYVDTREQVIRFEE